jgi:hypothetical protein
MKAETLVLIGGTGTGKTQVSIAREADAEWQDDEDREPLASTK